MSARMLKVLTLFAATVLSACTYAPYHTGAVVRDHDYGYNDSLHDDFYFYPSLGIYFNIHSGYYYYEHEHRWIRTRSLPRHYNLHPDHRVRLKAHRDKPYRDYQQHHQRYRSDGDRGRQFEKRDDKRRRYDRNERDDRRSSLVPNHGPRRFDRSTADDRRTVGRQHHTRNREQERRLHSSDTDRDAAQVRRLKQATTTEKRRMLYRDAQRRQEIRRGQLQREGKPEEPAHRSGERRGGEARGQNASQTRDRPERVQRPDNRRSAADNDRGWRQGQAQGRPERPQRPDNRRASTADNDRGWRQGQAQGRPERPQRPDNRRATADNDRGWRQHSRPNAGTDAREKPRADRRSEGQADTQNKRPWLRRDERTAAQ